MSDIYKTPEALRARSRQQLQERYKKDITGLIDVPPELTAPELDLAHDMSDILTGPTSGGNADFLATCCVRYGKAPALASRLIEAGERYQKATRKRRSKSARVQLERAARALLDAYGGNPPDWLRAEFAALETALNSG